MLEGLYTIDWDSFDDHECPNPPGMSISDAILGLTSIDANIRSHATYELHDRIFPWQPETIPRIIPFLRELIAASETPDRYRIISMLASLAYDVVGYTERAENSQQRLIDGIKQQISEGANLYIACLFDPDPRARESAARLLGLVPDESFAAPLLSQFETEQLDSVRVSILDALGKVSPHEAVKLAAQSISSEEQKIRLQAAVTLATLGIHTAQTVQILVDECFVKAPKPAINRNIRDILKKHYPDEYQAAVIRWASQLNVISKQFIADYAFSIMFLVFDTRPPGLPLLGKDELSEPQRIVLSAIIGCKKFWQQVQNDAQLHRKVTVWLESFGLPSNYNELLELLGA